MPNLLLCAALAALPFQAPREAVPVDSAIVEVTVYSGFASVKRRAELPAGGGSFVLSGLPRAIDPGALRVKSEGGEVVGVELRERLRRDVPDARVAELRERVRTLERELEAVQDEGRVLAKLAAHVGRLLGDSKDGPREGEGRVSVEAWEENFTYLSAKLADVRKRQRENGWSAEEVGLRLTDARLELGRFEDSGAVPVYDLIVDAFGAGEGPNALEVEYVVANAGWVPAYDLRAPKNLADVELVYRARVWQRTGEDWRDVDLLLSTAQPQRGAQGPEPRPVWARLEDPRVRKAVPRQRVSYDDFDAGDVAAGEAPTLGAVFAGVDDQGISVRFRLARKETIESRDQPTNVLIGRARVDTRPEHYTAPAVDPTVWLRARATNTSDWVMLPGRAAVYFGADFLGHAQLPGVQREEEFTLHLGPDPGLIVERTKLQDLTEEPGVFGSKTTLTEAWRINLKNRGAFSRAADGSVRVFVHEVLPKTKDDRIEVSIENVRPALATSERWKKEREEKGVLTWAVRVPKGGGTTIDLTTSIEYPEDAELVRD